MKAGQIHFSDDADLQSKDSNTPEESQRSLLRWNQSRKTVRGRLLHTIAARRCALWSLSIRIDTATSRRVAAGTRGSSRPRSSATSDFAFVLFYFMSTAFICALTRGFQVTALTLELLWWTTKQRSAAS